MTAISGQGTPVLAATAWYLASAAGATSRRAHPGDIPRGAGLRPPRSVCQRKVDEIWQKKLPGTDAQNFVRKL